MTACLNAGLRIGRDGLGAKALGLCALIALGCACSHPRGPAQVRTLPAAPQASMAPCPQPERPARDTPRVTEGGVHYTVPAGWSLTTEPGLAVVEAPEGDLRLAIVDLAGPSHAQPEVAVAHAFARYGHTPPARLKASEGEPTGGWKRVHWFVYELLPTDTQRVLGADVRWAGEQGVVVILDATRAALDRRSGEFAVLDRSLQPTGYARESLAGRLPRPLTAARLKELDAFIERYRSELSTPGVAVAIAQAGQVVHARGYGFRLLGQPERVGPHTRFRIASVTKSLTSLLVARLVDAGKLRWDQPVIELYPSFALGDAEVTRSIRLEHLMCACTGLPRADMEWVFQLGRGTPEQLMASLAALQPTTAFGQTHQYSNHLAAAAGFVAGHALAPQRPLGEAYDDGMAAWVFEPLGMVDTTLDNAVALAGEHAIGHTWSLPGAGETVAMDTLGIDRATNSIRPAGGVWSSAHDLIKLVQLELAGGQTVAGQRFVTQANLRKRQQVYAKTADHVGYGLGLAVDRRLGTPIVGHGGHTRGYVSDMFWLPEHDLGAVFLSNGDEAAILAQAFRRYLLEAWFSAELRAERDVRMRIERERVQLAELLATLTLPAESAAVANLAARYEHARLGRIDVERTGPVTRFDFGAWRSEVGSRRHADAALSLMTTTPGYDGFEFWPDRAPDGRRRLVLRDAQHEYAFVEVPR